MLIKKRSDLKSSEITSESVYLNRRHLIKGALALSVGSAFASNALRADELPAKGAFSDLNRALDLPSETLTPESIATSYNNFYELGTGKKDPARNAAKLKTQDWRVKISGECDKPGDYTLEDILKPHSFEERVYRLRCVEAWSMVIPWVGFSLGDLIKRFEPNSRAKYVQFVTLMDPVNLPGQRQAVLDWPYVEGLRMDEAMHPLSLMAVGMYGKVLPNQNGAPLRLVVPWKYGFKSIKSIVEIRFTEKQPETSWNRSAPHEYGFYSNVNPDVSHPRWSQAKERRLDKEVSGFSALLQGKIPTLPFNGYAEQVASLYSGMDLSRHF